MCTYKIERASVTISPPTHRVRMLFHLLFSKCARLAATRLNLTTMRCHPPNISSIIHPSLHTSTSSDADAAVTATHLLARVKIAIPRKMYNFQFCVHCFIFAPLSARSLKVSHRTFASFCLMQCKRRDTQKENNGNGVDDEKITKKKCELEQKWRQRND